jgi:hypothetical protein
MKNKGLTTLSLVLMLFSLIFSARTLAWGKKCCLSYYDCETEICECSDDEEDNICPMYPEPHIRETKEVKLSSPSEPLAENKLEDSTSMIAPQEQNRNAQAPALIETGVQVQPESTLKSQNQLTEKKEKPSLQQESSSNTNYYPGLW